MHNHICNFQNDLLYKNSNLKFNIVEELILDQICDKVNSGESAAICIPNNDIIFPLVSRIVHKDYDIGYKSRKDIGRRVSVLVITSVLYLKDIIENTKVSTKYIFSNSIQKQNFYYSMGRENLLDNGFNAQSYWKDILFKKYGDKKNIPEFIDYKDVFPVASGNSTFNTMSRNYMGNYDNEQQLVYYITSNREIFSIANLPIFDYVFIDYSRINKFIKNIPNDIQTFYFFDTLLDDRLLYLGKLVKEIVALDSSLLQEFIPYESGNYVNNISGLSKSITKMIADSQIRGFQVEYIECEFEDSIEEAILRFNCGKKSIGMDYEKKILSQLITNILTIPVNAIEYDYIACKQVYADSNMELLREIRNREEIYKNTDLARCMESLEDVFNKYKFDQYCPKQDIVLRHIKKNLNENKKILIVTASKISNITLKTVVADYLEFEAEQLEMNGISILTRSDLDHKAETYLVDTLLLTVCNSLRDINTLTKIRYKKAVAVLYKAEIENIKNKLEDINSKVSNYSISFFMDRLHGFCKEPGITIYSQLLNKVRSVKVAKKSRGLLDLSVIFDTSKERNYVDIYKEYKEYKGSNAIEAKLIEFDDGTFTFIDRKGYARILSPSQKDIIDEDIEHISPGDKVIFIDGQAHKDLYDIIIKNISTEAKFFINSLLVREWKQKLEDFIAFKQLTYQEIYKEMKIKGCKKKSQEAVKRWFTGASMGPNNAEDIKVLGEVMKVSVFINDYKTYFKALEETRVVRRVVARKLNEAIFSSNRRSRANEKQNDMLYGIYLEDIKSAIEVKNVKAIREELIKVKPSDVGKCFSYN